MPEGGNVSILVTTIDHVQVTVPIERMEAALAFYRDVLGLAEIPQPVREEREPGAWFRIGAAELHLRSEPTDVETLRASRRHVALAIADVGAAEAALAAAGIELLPDRRPVPGQRRLFLRDPGGNRVELVERRPA
jgi:catechol 2,3-dioxygenase-like lactoylglutathione lyase family enzyme